MDGFVFGLITGLLVGGPVGILAAALAVTAARADQRALEFDNLEYIDDEDDADL